MVLARYRATYNRLKHSAASRWRLVGMPAFDKLLTDISAGVEVDSDAVLPYLCMDLREDRLWANVSLAMAFHQAGNSRQAVELMRRAWLFSDRDERYLDLFVQVHVADSDIESIREAYKELGIRAASENKIAKALRHFNAWQYAYSDHCKRDEYHYDTEVLDRIAQLAEPHVLPVRKSKIRASKKVSLAYLVFGMTHLNSVIVKNCLTFARHHDRENFDVTFYIPDQLTSVLERREAVENIRKIEAEGWKVVLAPDSFSEERSLIDFSRSIYDAEHDILITSAGLADFKHYFIAATEPAPVVIGLCQGPPPQYIAPDFDHAISWTKHPLIDCPTDCSLVKGATDLPSRQVNIAEAKGEFGIAEDELVLMSCGRPSKYQDLEMWLAIFELLRSLPQLYFVVVGLDSPPAFLKSHLTQDVIGRVRFVGRVKEFQRVLSMADVVVDTYPSGGGMTVVDAMALGTPVVAFKNDYMKEYSQTDWSPAEEFMGMPELVVGRGDFEQMNNLLKKLLTDHEYRVRVSKQCVERIQETTGDQEQMIRDCELIYMDVLKSKASNLSKAKK